MKEQSYPPEPHDTFVQKIPTSAPYRPIIVSLWATKGKYIERLVKSGVVKRLEKMEQSFIKILLAKVHQRHWKLSNGELFAFPSNAFLDCIAGCSAKYSYTIIESLIEKGLLERAEREIDGRPTQGYLLKWAPEVDSPEWIAWHKKKYRRRRIDEPIGPMLPFSEQDAGGLQSTIGGPQSIDSGPQSTGSSDSSPPSHNNERARAELNYKNRNTSDRTTRTKAPAQPTSPATTTPAVVDVVVGPIESEEEKNRKAECVEALRNNGIKLLPNHWIHEAIDGGLTAENVQDLSLELMGARVRDPAALLAKHIKERWRGIVAGTDKPRHFMNKHEGKASKWADRRKKEYESDLPDDETVLGDAILIEDAHARNVLETVNDWELDWHIQQVMRLPANSKYLILKTLPSDVRKGHRASLLPEIIRHIKAHPAPEKLKNCGEFFTPMRPLPEVE